MTYDPAIDPALERIEFMWQAVHRTGGWCRQEGNWSFGWDRYAYWDRAAWPWAAEWLYGATGWLRRVLLTLKCLVCIVLDSEDPSHDYMTDWVDVALWNFYGWQSMDFPGTAYNFDLLAVPYGWRDWRFTVYSSSTA